MRNSDCPFCEDSHVLELMKVYHGGSTLLRKDGNTLHPKKEMNHDCHVSVSLCQWV